MNCESCPCPGSIWGLCGVLQGLGRATASLGRAWSRFAGFWVELG